VAGRPLASEKSHCCTGATASDSCPALPRRKIETRSSPLQRSPGQSGIPGAGSAEVPVFFGGWAPPVDCPGEIFQLTAFAGSVERLADER